MYPTFNIDHHLSLCRCHLKTKALKFSIIKVDIFNLVPLPQINLCSYDIILAGISQIHFSSVYQSFHPLIISSVTFPACFFHISLFNVSPGSC